MGKFVLSSQILVPILQSYYVRNVNQTGDSDTDSSDFEEGIEQLSLYTVKKNADAPILLQVKVNGKEIKIELDTGYRISRGEIETSGFYGRYS